MTSPVGEALGLRWADVDLEAATATIRQTVITVKHEVQFGEPTTASGRRTVTLDPVTVRALREHRGGAGCRAAADGVRLD